MTSPYNKAQKELNKERARNMLLFEGKHIFKVKRKVFDENTGKGKIITVTEEVKTKYDPYHIIRICKLSKAEAVELGVLKEKPNSIIQKIMELMSRKGSRKIKGLSMGKKGLKIKGEVLKQIMPQEQVDIAEGNV